MANQTISPEAIYQLSTKLFEFGRSPRLFSPEFRADLRLAAHMLRQLLFDGVIMKEIELTPEAERYVYQAGDLTVSLPPADDDKFLVELTGEQRETLIKIFVIAMAVDQNDNVAEELLSAVRFAATKRSWLATASNMSDTAGEGEV
jgi:hypothetical protein